MDKKQIFLVVVDQISSPAKVHLVCEPAGRELAVAGQGGGYEIL